MGNCIGEFEFLSSEYSWLYYARIIAIIVDNEFLCLFTLLDHTIYWNVRYNHDNKLYLHEIMTYSLVA